MQDPLQSTSTVPLPAYQTTQGRLDPLPQGSPELTAKQADQDIVQRTVNQNDGFRAYLDNAQISHVAQLKRSLEYDHANEINDRSAYKDSGRSHPI